MVTERVVKVSQGGGEEAAREWIGNEERNGESEGWRYDRITERERDSVEGKEKRGDEDAGEIAVD